MGSKFSGIIGRVESVLKESCTGGWEEEDDSDDDDSGSGGGGGVGEEGESRLDLETDGLDVNDSDSRDSGLIKFS